MRKLMNILLGLAMAAPGYGQETIEPRLDIQYSYSHGRQPMATVLVRKRIDRRYFPMQGIPVAVYFGSQDEEAKIGKLVTNEKGIAVMHFSETIVARWDSLSSFDLLAVAEATDSTEEVYESIAVTKAKLTVKGELNDDEKIVMARVEQWVDGVWNPVGGVELKLFIKRDFGHLPIGADSYETDESGFVEMKFEEIIPGDETGKITLGALVEEHDDFGTLYGFDEVNWGKLTVDDNTEFNRRTLWATRDKTPLWLLIFPNLIILGVWGVIGYLVWQIYYLKKLAKEQ